MEVIAEEGSFSPTSSRLSYEVEDIDFSLEDIEPFVRLLYLILTFEDQEEEGDVKKANSSSSKASDLNKEI